MLKTENRPAPSYAATPRLQPAPSNLARLKLLGTLGIILVLCFGTPLYELARFARGSDLYSHALLIPFISAYLIWLKRGSFVPGSRPAPWWAMIPVWLGLSMVALYWIGVHYQWKLEVVDYLFLMTGSFVLLLAGLCLAVLGKTNFAVLVFPLAMLSFMAPLPALARRWVETFLQNGSAEAAWLMLKLSGMPVLKAGTYFQLPGLSMEVAPECSGIHSSIVLLISSLLAGQLLLRSNWSRAVLVLAIVPLALLRNGFRIFTLAQLSVQVDRNFIHSDLHHRGGPIFFALSLLPLFLLLWALRKWERRFPTQN